MRKHRPDFSILLITLGLMAAGLIIVYAIGPRTAQSEGFSSDYYFSGHLKAIFASLVVLGISAFLPYKLIVDTAESTTSGSITVPEFTCEKDSAGLNSSLFNIY